MKEDDFVSIWLEESGNPAIEELTQINVEVAAQTAKVLAGKGLTENDLAIELDIYADEIKRWLMGKHAYSVKTLKKISGSFAN